MRNFANNAAIAVCLGLWGIGAWHDYDWTGWLSMSEFILPPIGIIRGALLLLGVI